MVIVILLAIIQGDHINLFVVLSYWSFALGLIIDSFGELREKEKSAREDMKV